MTLSSGRRGADLEAVGVPGRILAVPHHAVDQLARAQVALGQADLHGRRDFLVERDLVDLPGHAKKVGNYLQEKLNGLRAERPYITDVRGYGLLVGIEFDSDIAGEVMGKLIEEGVLMNAPAGNILRFMPPLVLTEDEVDEVVGKLAKVLDEVKAKATA